MTGLIAPHQDSLSSPVSGVDVVVSSVANAHTTRTRDESAERILAGIRRGRWRAVVERIRAEYSRARSEGRDPKSDVAELKKQLPGVLWSGRFVRRANDGLLAHSGLLCADLDNLGDRIATVREQLIASPYAIATFLSPTGSGIKVLFRVPSDASAHLASFQSVRRHVRELTGCRIDEACKDVARLCFVSFDPDLWTRAGEADEMPPSAPQDSSASCILHPASLHVCIPAPLHNNSDLVLERICARREAKMALAVRSPGLSKLYERFVEPRFEALPHARNEFLTEAVPFLFRAVAEQLVLGLVGCFYDCHRALFHDSREQHMREAGAMLEAVNRTYLGQLTTDERAVYGALSGRERDTFRICRDLALLPTPARELLTFYLSFEHLGDRIGLHPTQAQRLMRRFEGDGLLRLLEKGTRRAIGVPGKAGLYQWLLPTAGAGTELVARGAKVQNEKTPPDVIHV